jgi:hypothetical protein
VGVLLVPVVGLYSDQCTAYYLGTIISLHWYITQYYKFLFQTTEFLPQRHLNLLCHKFPWFLSMARLLRKYKYSKRALNNRRRTFADAGKNSCMIFKVGFVTIRSPILRASLELPNKLVNFVTQYR